MIAERRICLFGGTFDPIHQAHLRIAEEAAKRFTLDRVVFVPAANPPHKPTVKLTPYEHRLRMAELACSPYGAFSVSRVEAGKKPSYTINTVERFRQDLERGDRLFFLIGSDAFNELETWKRWQELVRLTEFIVVSRPGGQYRAPPGATIHLLDGLELPVSSSTIRERLAASKPTPELPPQVREYVEEHGLYGARKKNASALLSRSTNRKLPSGA